MGKEWGDEGGVEEWMAAAADDEFAQEFKEAMASGDARRQWTVVRDAIANELMVHRCDRCTASRLRTGDQAALYLRLTTVLKELSELPEANSGEELTGLAKIRAERGNVIEMFPAAGQ